MSQNRSRDFLLNEYELRLENFKRFCEEYDQQEILKDGDRAVLAVGFFIKLNTDNQIYREQFSRAQGSEGVKEKDLFFLMGEFYQVARDFFYYPDGRKKRKIDRSWKIPTFEQFNGLITGIANDEIPFGLDVSIPVSEDSYLITFDGLTDQPPIKNRIEKIPVGLSREEYYLIIFTEYKAMPDDEKNNEVGLALRAWLQEYRKTSPLPLHSAWRSYFRFQAQALLEFANLEHANKKVNPSLSTIEDIAYDLMQCKSIKDWNDLAQRIGETTHTQLLSLKHNVGRYVEKNADKLPEITVDKLNVEGVEACFEDFSRRVKKDNTPVSGNVHRSSARKYSYLNARASELISSPDIARNEEKQARLCAVCVALSYSKNNDDKALAADLKKYFPVNLVEKYRADHVGVMLVERCLAGLSAVKTKNTKQQKELETYLLNMLDGKIKPDINVLSEHLAQLSGNLKKHEVISFFGHHRLREFIDGFRKNLEQRGHVHKQALMR